MTTYSTSSGSIPDRSSAARIAMPPSSVAFSVREPSTETAERSTRRGDDDRPAHASQRSEASALDPPGHSHRLARRPRASQPLERAGHSIHELARLRQLFPERGQLGGMSCHRLRGANEIAHRRLGRLGDLSQAWERRHGHAALPARHGDRLDPERFGQLLLRQTEPKAAPRARERQLRRFPAPSTRADPLTCFGRTPPHGPTAPIGRDEVDQSAGPTLTSIFPMFSPRSSPTNAPGAFSIPSMIVSR